MSDFIVIKRNHLGEEVYRWNGRILERTETQVSLEALFALSGHGTNVPKDGVLLGEVRLFVGDRFVETYYTDRWYNIFEIHSRDDDRLKGWYCNIAYPAQFGATDLSFRDLALDLLVYPDGRQLVLDDDEFRGLNLSPPVAAQALEALAQLQQHFALGFPNARGV